MENSLYFEQWILMFDFREDLLGSLREYRKILPPKDRFWADPHVLFKNNEYYIYFEEYLYKSKKGRISLIVMDREGNYEGPIVALEKPYHLSYPFVFKFGADYYMIPETIGNDDIELYKCVDFPSKWEFKTRLMANVKAADATLFQQDDLWWLFVNLGTKEGRSTFDKLFLFYSDELFNDNWEPHPLNPIISDIKRARPAGKIFERDGKVYRPSQNCSIRYGYGFNINEITTLNKLEYEEKIVASIEPLWDRSIVATHTFNREKNLSVIDAVIRRGK